MTRSLIAALAFALALAVGCGGDGGNVPDPSRGESAGASGTLRPTVAPGQPLVVPEDGGPVPLVPGTYTTQRLAPAATFTVGEGWSAQRDNERLASIFQPLEASPRVLTVFAPDGVIDGETGLRQPLPESVEALVQWIAENQRLTASNPSALQVGVIGGLQLEVSLRDDVQTEPLRLLAAGSDVYDIVPGEKQHFIVLDYNGAPLVIAFRAPEAEFPAFFSQVEPVIGSLIFSG